MSSLLRASIFLLIYPKREWANWKKLEEKNIKEGGKKVWRQGETCWTLTVTSKSLFRVCLPAEDVKDCFPVKEHLESWALGRALLETIILRGYLKRYVLFKRYGHVPGKSFKGNLKWPHHYSWVTLGTLTPLTLRFLMYKIVIMGWFVGMIEWDSTCELVRIMPGAF